MLPDYVNWRQMTQNHYNFWFIMFQSSGGSDIVMEMIPSIWRKLTSNDSKWRNFFDASVMTLYDFNDVFWHLLTFFDVLWRFQFLKNWEKNFLTIFDDFMTFFDVAVNFGTVLNHLTSKTDASEIFTSIDVNFRQIDVNWPNHFHNYIDLSLWNNLENMLIDNSWPHIWRTKLSRI